MLCARHRMRRTAALPPPPRGEVDAKRRVGVFIVRFDVGMGAADVITTPTRPSDDGRPPHKGEVKAPAPFLANTADRAREGMARSRIWG